MLLANELFEEVLGSLASASPAAAAATTPTGGGQRREPRMPVNTRLTLFPFEPGAEAFAGYDFPRNATGALQVPIADPLSVPVRDLSRGGLRFLMPRRLPLDTPFVLLLPRPTTEIAAAPSKLPPAVECTVTYWQPLRRDLFAIGARFGRMLEGFVPPATQPSVVLQSMPLTPALIDTPLAPRIAV